MKVVHRLGQASKIERKIASQDDQYGLLLANPKGYLWVSDNNNYLSRYQGWFFRSDGFEGLFKILESIKISCAGKPIQVSNLFFAGEKRREGFCESFFLASEKNALIYETDKKVWAEILLDYRESYDCSDSGRYYETEIKNGFLLIKCRNENSALGDVFLALKSDLKNNEPGNGWVRRDYGFDRARNSFPFQRWVYSASKLKTNKISFAVSTNAEQAMEDADLAFKKSAFLKGKEKERIEKKLSKCLPKKFIANKKEKIFGNVRESGTTREKAYAYFCALSSLDSLLVRDLGLYAGLPWFFQFWQRDEALCLKALMSLDPSQAKKIYLRQKKDLEKIHLNKKLPFWGDDAEGWFFLRAKNLWDFGILLPREKKEVVLLLEKTISRLLKEKTKEGLAVNASRGTWMDSLDRAGACIEIQAQRLFMYDWASKICAIRHRKKYLKLKETLQKEIRIRFWNSRVLADSWDFNRNEADFTVRPNIFLACYFYRGLLTDEEWTVCFKTALAHLWLPWGGLATISRQDCRYCSCHSGENSLSYHNGDSWMYLNDLAALVMKNIDAKRFNFEIDKIFQASAYDLLWNGLIGHASELSPASKFDSCGCQNQAWSSAAFVELYEALFPGAFQNNKI